MDAYLKFKKIKENVINDNLLCGKPSLGISKGSGCWNIAKKRNLTVVNTSFKLLSDVCVELLG